MATPKAGEGNNIDQFGAQLGYGGESGDVGYNVAVGYILITWRIQMA